jgi:hypothetical protein
VPVRSYERPFAIAWQAATSPVATGANVDASRRQRPAASGQRGWKVQPGGGHGLGTSPRTVATDTCAAGALRA